MADKKTIAETIGGVAEVVGHELSPIALRLMVRELERYPDAQVIGALHRCARECKFKLTLADILDRLDDGRPGAEEAWAMIPRNEDATVVWTDEMASAWAAARPLLEEGEPISARMAFLETYRREITTARAASRPCRWWPSLGHDIAERATVIAEAVIAGRLTAEHAIEITPQLRNDPNILRIAHEQAERRIAHVESEKLTAPL